MYTATNQKQRPLHLLNNSKKKWTWCNTWCRFCILFIHELRYENFATKVCMFSRLKVFDNKLWTIVDASIWAFSLSSWQTIFICELTMQLSTFADRTNTFAIKFFRMSKDKYFETVWVKTSLNFSMYS